MRTWHWKNPRFVAVLVFLALAGYWCARTSRHAGKSLASDFGVYYRAGEAIGAGTPVYELSHGPLLTFKYAPVVALGWWPLSLLPAPVARGVWCLVDLSLLLCLVMSAARVVGDKGERWWVGWGVVLLTLGHLVAQLQSGQSTSLWLLLVVLGFEALTREKSGRGGVYLAAAVCLKCVPLAVAPYLLLTGRPMRGLLAFAGGLVFFLFVPAAFIGWERNLDLVMEWPRHLRETITLEQVLRPENQSVLAQSARWLVDFGWEPLVARELAERVWMGSALLFGAGAYGWLLVTKSSATPAAHLAILLLFLTAFNPLAWRYNFVALVVPYAYVLHALEWRFDGRWVLVILAGGLCTLPWPSAVMEQGGRLVGLGLLTSAVVWTMDARGEFRQRASRWWTSSAAWRGNS